MCQGGGSGQRRRARFALQAVVKPQAERSWEAPQTSYPPGEDWGGGGDAVEEVEADGGRTGAEGRAAVPRLRWRWEGVGVLVDAEPGLLARRGGRRNADGDGDQPPRRRPAGLSTPTCYRSIRLKRRPCKRFLHGPVTPVYFFCGHQPYGRRISPYSWGRATTVMHPH
jgi:hypothetical protein